MKKVGAGGRDDERRNKALASPTTGARAGRRVQEELGLAEARGATARKIHGWRPGNGRWERGAVERKPTDESKALAEEPSCASFEPVLRAMDRACACMVAAERIAEIDPGRGTNGGQWDRKWDGIGLVS